MNIFDRRELLFFELVFRDDPRIEAGLDFFGGDADQ